MGCSSVCTRLAVCDRGDWHSTEEVGHAAVAGLTRQGLYRCRHAVLAAAAERFLLAASSYEVLVAMVRYEGWLVMEIADLCHLNRVGGGRTVRDRCDCAARLQVQLEYASAVIAEASYAADGRGDHS